MNTWQRRRSLIMLTSAIALLFVGVPITNSRALAQDSSFLKQIAAKHVTENTVFFQKPTISRNNGKFFVTPADVRQDRPAKITAIEYLLERQIEIELYRKYLYETENERETFSVLCDEPDALIESAHSQLAKLSPTATPDERFKLAVAATNDLNRAINDAITVVENLAADTQAGGAASSIALADPATIRKANRRVEFMPLSQWSLNSELPSNQQFGWTMFTKMHERFTGAFRFRTVGRDGSVEITTVLTYTNRIVDFSKR